MKFSIIVNLERLDKKKSMEQVDAEATELARIADAGGFETVYVGEHHTIELTASPNPFIQLARWSSMLPNIRLGTAVIAVPYWHPIRLAGEAGALDLLSGGRLELGLGRGAYQYEFDRMSAGLDAERARELTVEFVPLLRRLWEGQVERSESPWPFPRATSVPKPLQSPYPPMWIAARHPMMFDFAVKNKCNVMVNPLTKGFEEVRSLKDRFDEAVANNPEMPRPRFMVSQNVCVYDEGTDWRETVLHLRERTSRFQTLFRDATAVKDGFPEPTNLDQVSDAHLYTLQNIHDSQLFGTPDMVTEKLRKYDALGVDGVIYGATWGQPHDLARRSLELFSEHVLPVYDGSAR